MALRRSESCSPGTRSTAEGFSWADLPSDVQDLVMEKVCTAYSYVYDHSTWNQCANDSAFGKCLVSREFQRQIRKFHSAAFKAHRMAGDERASYVRWLWGLPEPHTVLVCFDLTAEGPAWTRLPELEWPDEVHWGPM